MPPAKRPSKPKSKPPASDDSPETIGSLLEAKPAPAAPAAPAAPIALDQIHGQSHAIQTLESSLSSDRVHHAWIFHGPEGVGKFTTAIAFAAKLLGVPTTHIKTHPDFHLVTKELASVSRDQPTRGRKQLNIPLEVLREFFLEPAALAANQPAATPTPATKVFIIDQADILDLRGQNALLKTLEEPPVGTVIILVTSDEMSLLTTIRSRCQRVGFLPLDPKSMAAWLGGANLTFDPFQRDWLTWYAQGSPGAFERTVKCGLYSWHETLEPLLAPTDTGQPPGPGLPSGMAKLVDDRSAEQAKETANASKEAANRHWARQMLAFLAHRYASKLRDKKPASPLTPHKAMQALDLLSQAEHQIDANVRFSDVAENFAAQVALAHQP